MRKPIQFSSEIRGARVLLDVETNGSGGCGRDGRWLTEIGGHRGNLLRRLPASRGYSISQVPWFITPRTMGWTAGLASHPPVGSPRPAVERRGGLGVVVDAG